MKKRRLKKKFKICLFFLVVFIVVGSVGGISFKLLNEDKELNKDKDTTTKTTTTTALRGMEDKESTAKLTLVGDLLFEQPFYDAINKKNYDESKYFGLVKHYFEEDDLSIANMEVVIGNDKLQSSGTGYNFCAPESIGDLVNTLDFEVLSTANNHSYDRGIDGINSTIDYFKNKTDVLTVGTYKTKEDRNKNHILDINDIKFGFVSYTLGTNIKVPTEYRDLIGLYRDPDTKVVSDKYKNIMKDEISKLKENVDVVVVLVHWGKEFTNSANSEQKELAKFFNEQGVDIVVGSHSHSIQPIEWIGDKHKTLVYYSLGNFVSADDDISRTGEKFDNAYQFGLISTLEVKKNKDGISINNVKSEAIVNYFDTDMNNFKLIPLSKYTSTYENTHYRYQFNFNKQFVSDMFNNVIKEEFR